MNSEITFTTLEDQGKILQEYSNALTPLERLEILQELNRRVFGDKSDEDCLQSMEIKIYTLNEGETLAQMFERRKKDSLNEP